MISMNINMRIRSGTITGAPQNRDLCAARRFAQVKNIKIFKIYLLASGDEVSGASTMWKPASVFLVGIFLTLLIF